MAFRVVNKWCTYKSGVVINSIKKLIKLTKLKIRLFSMMHYIKMRSQESMKEMNRLLISLKMSRGQEPRLVGKLECRWTLKRASLYQLVPITHMSLRKTHQEVVYLVKWTRRRFLDLIVLNPNLHSRTFATLLEKHPQLRKVGQLKESHLTSPRKFTRSWFKSMIKQDSSTEYIL